MKGSERHRLKENELSHVLGDATARLQENRSRLALFGGLIALVLVVGIAYWAWTTRSETRAQTLLGVRLFRQDEQGRTPVEFGSLDPVDASETLLELETLAPPDAGH